MKLLLVTILSYLGLVSCTDSAQFFAAFFRHRHIRSVWFSCCSFEHEQILTEWRKRDGLVYLQRTSQWNLQLPTDFDPTEIIGLVVDVTCDSTRLISKLQREEALRRKSMVLLWGGGFPEAQQTLMQFRSLVTDVFFADSVDDDQIVYDCDMNMVFTWDKVNGLVPNIPRVRPSLPEKVVRGMVTLKDERRHDADLREILGDKNDETLNDNLMKFSFVLHQFLEKMYNFKWHLHLSGSQAIDQIYVTTNDSLNYFTEESQFGALKSGYVDVGLYPAELLPSGLDFMEFLHPLTTFRQFFIFSSPIVSLEPYIVYSQFSGTVWGVSISLAVMTALVSSVSARVASRDAQETNELTVITNFMIVIGAMAQQGLERTSEKLSVRIAHFFLLFLTLMLFIFYNTGLLIYTLNPTRKELESFNELLLRDYVVAAEDTPYNRFQLQGNYSHPDEWFYRNCATTWGTCRTNVDFHNLTTGLEKVISNRTALFGYGSDLYGALGRVTSDRQQSDLRELAVHRPFLIGTFVRKHFQYKELFSRGLLLLKEAGIAYHEDAKWNYKKPDPLMDSYFVVASLYSTSVAFMLLFCGIFVSLVILLFEFLVKNQKLTIRRGATLKRVKRLVSRRLDV